MAGVDLRSWIIGDLVVAPPASSMAAFFRSSLMIGGPSGSMVVASLRPMCSGI